MFFNLSTSTSERSAFLCASISSFRCNGNQAPSIRSSVLLIASSHLCANVIGITTNEGFPFCAIHSTVDLQVRWKLVATLDMLTTSPHPSDLKKLSVGVQHSPKLQPFSSRVFTL